MKTLNLTLKAIVTSTELFGVPTNQISECMLIDAIKGLQSHIKTLKELNQTANSEKVTNDIKKLESSLTDVVNVLDGDYKLAEIAQGNQFDLDLPSIRERVQVFGVYVEDLTEEALTEAIQEIQSRVEKAQALNKGLGSKRIESQIEQNQEYIKILVEQLDNLPESK